MPIFWKAPSKDLLGSRPFGRGFAMWAVSFEPQFSGLGWEAMKKQMQLAMFFSVTNGEIYVFCLMFVFTIEDIEAFTDGATLVNV